MIEESVQSVARFIKDKKMTVENGKLCERGHLDLNTPESVENELVFL